MHALHKVQNVSGFEGKVHVLQATDYQMSTILGPDVITITLLGEQGAAFYLTMLQKFSLSFWSMEGKYSKLK